MTEGLRCSRRSCALCFSRDRESRAAIQLVAVDPSGNPAAWARLQALDAAQGVSEKFARRRACARVELGQERKREARGRCDGAAARAPQLRRVRRAAKCAREPPAQSARSATCAGGADSTTRRLRAAQLRREGLPRGQVLSRESSGAAGWRCPLALQLGLPRRCRAGRTVDGAATGVLRHVGLA